MAAASRTFFPFAVRVHPQFVNLFFVLLAFVAIREPSAAVVVRFGAGFAIAAFCLLAHELGHAFAARAAGIEVHEVVIHPLGGVAKLLWRADDPALEWRVAAAGPAVNLAFAAVAFGVAAATGPDPDAWFLPTFLGVNLVVGCGNLLPAFPLDGGRILRALLTPRLGAKAATEAAVRTGRVIAAALFALALVPGASAGLGGETRFALFLFGLVVLALGEWERWKIAAMSLGASPGGGFGARFVRFGSPPGTDPREASEHAPRRGSPQSDFVDVSGEARIVDDEPPARPGGGPPAPR
jgi:Zn-dependent protease